MQKLWIALPLLACSCAESPRTFTIVAINDVYRIEGIPAREGRGMRGGLARLRTLRARLEQDHPDLIFLHGGDLLYPSLLSRSYDGKQMVDILNRMDGAPEAFDKQMLVTFGNHEFDPRNPSILHQRVAESEFRWLASDLTFTGVSGDNLVRKALLDSGGIKVGVFSVTTEMRDPDYVEFAEPIATARKFTAELRSDGAEYIIGLTHQQLSKDEEMLHKLAGDGPDIIIGGHDHSRQEKRVNGRWILKADSDARTATVVHVTLGDGAPAVEHRFVELGPTEPAPDAAVQARVDQWLNLHAVEYCQNMQPPSAPGCLDTKLGKTAVELLGEETEIRRFETNLGNWVADVSRDAFAAQGAQIAFVASGNLRLNHDIPAGADITERHLVETFQYPASLKLLRIRGAVLKQVVARSVEAWTGNGWFLQISGFAFKHDPSTGSATDLTLLTSSGPKPIGDDDVLLAVTHDFLVNPATGQDGYTMLKEEFLVKGAPSPDMRQSVEAALLKAGDTGIAPAVEGRICNPERPNCLALSTLIQKFGNVFVGQPAWRAHPARRFHTRVKALERSPNGVKHYAGDSQAEAFTRV